MVAVERSNGFKRSLVCNGINFEIPVQSVGDWVVTWELGMTIVND